MKLLKFLCLPICGLIILTSCNQESKNEYPVAATQNFMNSCQKSGGSQDNCACMLEKIQKKYSYQEFTSIERKVNQNQSPKEFQEFAKLSKIDCLKK